MSSQIFSIDQPQMRNVCSEYAESVRFGVGQDEEDNLFFVITINEKPYTFPDEAIPHMIEALAVMAQGLPQLRDHVSNLQPSPKSTT